MFKLCFILNCVTKGPTNLSLEIVCHRAAESHHNSFYYLLVLTEVLIYSQRATKEALMLLSTMQGLASNGTEIKVAQITGADLKNSYWVVTVQAFYC